MRRSILTTYVCGNRRALAQDIDASQQSGRCVDVRTPLIDLPLPAGRPAPSAHGQAVADGGQAGIDTFIAAARHGEPFAVVISDLGMPYIDGRKVAAAVKGESSWTPVLLVTGWGYGMRADSDYPAHVDRLLSKPTNVEELRQALAELTA
jgi:CheY-like chemotaxis protein